MSTPLDQDAQPLRGQFVEPDLAQFFGYANEIFVILDQGGRVRLASPSVERVLGHPLETILGVHILRWIHPKDRATVKTQARTAEADQNGSDVDARVRHADGGWVPMRWSLSMGPEGRAYATGRDRSAEVRHRKARLQQEIAELRLRTTLELHDGILQMLTGASLQIKVALSLLRTDPSGVEKVLRGLAESISAEQREMRLYVDEVKGRSPAWTDASLSLSRRIETIIDRVGMIWGVGTSVEANVSSGVPPELARQVLRVIQEATVNAARHGGAKSVDVEVTEDNGGITISVTDDGTGFSFLGEYDHEALVANRLGPLSLKHRVEEVRGRISITSTKTGSQLVVRIPVVEEAYE